MTPHPDQALFSCSREARSAIVRRMRTLHRFPSSLAMSIVGILLVPAIAFAQDPLKLNVPYRCTDGVTRTVTRCATNERGGEVCFWTETQNGQSNDRFNVRSQMDGWL